MAIANEDTNRTNNDRGLATSAVPQGHKKLILAVPHKPSFEDIVSSSIYIFKTAMEKLQDPPYELCAFSGTYDELISNVSHGVFDGAVGDVTITDERVKVVDFTAAYAPSGLALLVLADVDREPPIQWIFLKPLTKELWITTVGFFFFTGFVVWLIEAPRNPEYQGVSILRQFMTAWYFIFSTLKFSHDQRLKSPLSKIALVIWCFKVLVLVQSYTANLSSMLTTKRLLTGLDRLVRGHDYIGYQRGGFVDSMLINKGVPSYRLRAYNDETEYMADALRKGSKNGGVSAIVDEIPYLSYFLSEHKKDFGISEQLNVTLGLGFVFRKGCNKTLVDDLSIAITNILNGHQSSKYKEEWFDPAAILTDSGDSERLSLRRFSGLFVITGCVSALMLLISVTRSVYAKYTRVMRGSESQSAIDDDGSIARLDELSAPQHDTQRIQEVRDNDSQGAHGSGGSTGGDDEEDGAMQDSISNASVPEVSVQIEMTSTGQSAGRALYTAIPNG